MGFLIGSNNSIGSKRLLQTLFVIILTTLQFEEHNIAGISVFRLIILPLSLLGLLISFTEKGNKRCVPIQIMFFTVLIYLFVVCASLSDLVDAINKVLLIPFTLFLTYCFTDEAIKKVRYDRIFIWGPLASLIALLTGSGFKGTLRFCGIYFDPNFLCIFCILGIVSKLVFFPIIKNRFEKTLWVCLIALDFIELFLSQSRGGLLVVLIIGFIFILKVVKKRNHRVVLLVSSIVIGLYAWNYAQTLTLWSSAYENPVDQLLSRLNSEELEEGGGRTEMWERCIKYINENGNFFIPVGHANLYRYNGDFDTHNSFLDFLSDAGYFVFFLFFTPLFVHVFLYYRKRFTFSAPPEEVFLAIISVSMMILSFFLSYYTWKIFWLPIIMAWSLPVKYTHKSTSKQFAVS